MYVCVCVKLPPKCLGVRVFVACTYMSVHVYVYIYMYIHMHVFVCAKLPH